MNAHVQIPQLLLRKFQHEEIENYEGHINKLQCVYFIDLKTNIIDSEKTRTFGSEIDFYGTVGEKKLGDIVEEPFGNAINKIIKKEFETLNLDDYISIKRFAYFCILRSNNVLNALVNNQYLKSKNANKPESIITLVNDKNDYSDTCIEILLNGTSIDFVVPNNCLIFTTDYHILPISSKIALILKKKKTNEIAKYEFIVKSTNDEEYIKKINYASVAVEKRNRGIIIAKDKQTLLELANNLGIKICEKKGDA